MTTTEARLVGPYRLQRRLGEGGMGVVHLATASDGRLVAVKVLRPGVVAGEQGRERFAREVRALHRVRGPGVAEVHDADLTAAEPYVVTRYVDGRSLDRVVDDHGPLRPEAQRRLAAGLADALADVHAAGVVHRDVKPGNVMLDAAGVVLIDFGLARAVEDGRLTSTGLLVGTPGYLAPETVTGAVPTAATDVHGWAATVAFAAAGEGPYGEGPAAVVLDRIRRGEHRLQGLDAELDPLVRAGLALDPAARPTLPKLRARLAGAPTRPEPVGAPRTAALATPATLVEPMPRPNQAGVPVPALLPGWPVDLAEPRRLTGTGALTAAGLAALVVAGALAAPYLTLLLLLGALLAARTADRLRARLLRRRLIRGPSARNREWIALEAPWRALLAAPAAALHGLLVGVLAATAGALAWAVGSGARSPLLVAGAVAAAAAWMGPGSAAVRRGTRTVLRPLATHRRAGWSVAAIVLVATWVVLLVGEQWAPLWWPAEGPPQIGL